MARDLRLFYLFRLLATSYLWVPVLYFFMRSRGLEFDQIMLLGAIYCGVVILVEIPTGAYADRIGRRASMMAGALAMVASCLIAYVAHSFAVFVAAEVLAAVSMSLCSGADSAYLFDLLHDNGRSEEYAKRESTASAWHQAGNTIAFALGGLLGTIDLALPYLATAGVSALAFIVALGMRDERQPVRKSEPQPPSAELRAYFHHMRESVSDAWSNKALAWVIAYSAVVFVMLKATVYLYQPYLDSLSFSIAQIGFIYAGVYLVATVVAHHSYGLRRLVGESTLVWTLLGGLAVSFVLLDQIRGVWVMALLGVQAVAMGLYSPLVKPLLNREIPASERRATVLSVESIARRVMMGIFAPIAGYYGATEALYLSGGLGLVGFAALAILARYSPRTHRAATVPVVEEASAPAAVSSSLDQIG